jgi:hypothetical protein
VAVGATGHVDVLDAGTGACLGRLEAPDTPAKDWTALAVSADGKRLAAVAAVVGMVKVPRTVRVWDLGDGAAARTVRLGPGNWGRLDWCGERHVLVAGGELVDLGLGAAVAECQPSGFTAGGLISGSPDGRLWYLARNSDVNVETSPWSLLACTFTNPRTLKEVPGAAPAEREVVFYPGVEVALEVDFPNPAVKESAGAAMARLLQKEGFKVGPGSGWRLQVKGEEFDSNSRLTLEDRTTMVVPAVRGQVRLIAPDGTVAGGGEAHGVSLNVKSKYETKKMHQNGQIVTFYDFRGRNPRQALLEEFWERWLETLERVQWPRGMMRVQGKYEPLPPTVALAMDPAGS